MWHDNSRIAEFHPYSSASMQTPPSHKHSIAAGHQTFIEDDDRLFRLPSRNSRVGRQESSPRLNRDVVENEAFCAVLVLPWMCLEDLSLA